MGLGGCWAPQGAPQQVPRAAAPPEGLSRLCAAEAYVGSVLFCLGIFLSFYVLTLFIACWESCR